MASRRLPWSSPENRLARLVRRKREAGAAVLDLTASNPTRVGLDYPREAIAAALTDPRSASYEPEARGLRLAREAVSACLARDGHAVRPDRIVLTASTSEAYAHLFKTLADPGERVLVPRPSYPLFDYLAALESVRLGAYALEIDARWSLDLDGVERALRDEDAPPRALVVVNPNNPTGSALRRSERRRLGALCAARGVPIIADEVFFDYLDEPAAGTADPIVSFLDPCPGEAARPLTFTLGGLSKACGLPQMKLGWIVVGGPDDLADQALRRLELVADTFLSVGTPVQLAAARLLDLGRGIRESIRRRVRQNLGSLLGTASGSPAVRVLPRDGGWYAVLQIPAVRPEEDLVLALLEQDDVLVHPGYFFDFPREAFLVLSLLPVPGEFSEALRRVLARVSA